MESADARRTPMHDASDLLHLSRDSLARTFWCFTPSAAEEGPVSHVELPTTTAFVATATERSGVGLYAARAIRAGERLITEAPLATWSVPVNSSNAEKSASFEAMTAKLPQQTKKAILKLSQSSIHGDVQSLLGTWQTNGLPINFESTTCPGTTTREQASKEEAAIFATVCRLNHACRPNCHAEWNGISGKETVHALVDIPAGEELTIRYLAPGGLERRERRAELRANHGFNCCCATCELRGDALATSEARQRAIGASKPTAAEGKLPLAEQMKRLDVRLALMRDEGLPALWGWRPVLYYMASASVAELRRDPSQAMLKRAKSWAERARDVMCLAMGADHPASEFLATFLHKITRAS